MPRTPISQTEKKLLNNLGFILREIRIEVGYNSVDLFAASNGLSNSLYSRWESGENMNILSIMRLCSILKISLAELMDLWTTFNHVNSRHLYKEKKQQLINRILISKSE